MNPTFFTVKHHYNAGDLISILPGLRQIYRDTGRKALIYQVIDFPAHYYDGNVHATFDENGVGVTMNRKMLWMLRGLLIRQEYIEDMLPWSGEAVDYDFSKTRDSRSIPMPYGDIHWWMFGIFPEMICDLSEPWLEVDDRLLTVGNLSLGNCLLVNRTERYNNPYISYYFLKEYEEHTFFIGTEKEFELFNKQWGLNLSRLGVDHFGELASFMAQAKCFLGNQSMCYHIANGLKVPRILELCAPVPNCFPNGKNGYGFYYQEAAEYLVKKIMQ